MMADAPKWAVTGAGSARARPSVTAVVPTKNAAGVIGDCLASVAWADEIIVVDMHSTDGTQALCATHPQCRVIERDDYIFGNMNFGFQQAQSDWILRIDSDERITVELQNEIKGFLDDPGADVIGMECWERLFVLGQELHHGRGRRHHRKLLFRRGSANYQLRSEHEDLTSAGRWVPSVNGYIHLNYRRVEEYLTKTDYYTSLDVARADLPVRKPNIAQAIREVLRALYHYLARWRGYRDGWVGFVDGTMMAVYQFVLWAKLRERWEQESRNDHS